MTAIITPWYAYLIRLDQPIGSDRHRASYYLGIAKDYVRRLQEHTSGTGAKMLKSAVEQGRKIGLVQIWKFNGYIEARAFERWAKYTLKSHRKLRERTNWEAFGALSIPLPAPIYVPVSSL